MKQIWNIWNKIEKNLNSNQIEKYWKKKQSYEKSKQIEDKYCKSVGPELEKFYLKSCNKTKKFSGK